MGVVYRARDERLDRDVALKLLPGEVVGDDAARRRLEREAKTASALNHPNVCTIYDVGEADGQLYLAMEFVDGERLDRVCAPNGLPEATVVRIAVQLADALEHAHRHGIVHRDLKTANVVLTPEGRPKILDFGIAVRRHEHAETAATTTAVFDDVGSMAGTIPYMAPEVLRGATADARADVWALGVILFEMATGRRPFGGETPLEMTSSILRDDPSPLPAHVSAGLGSVVGKCLQKESANRYQHAGEVRAALEAIQGAAPGRAVSVVPRRRTIALGVAAAAAALLLVAFVATRVIGRAPVQPAITSLAVLPLQNLSGDASQDYFADGMTDALISDLAQIRALKVISRTSAMRYKGTTKSLPAIAQELGVDAVVEGSVVRVGDRVRVTAQLIHAATDTHVWAQNYERDASSVLALQNDVSAAIANEIRVQLTPRERERLSTPPAVNPAAHEAYLRGRYYWNTRTDEGLQRSIRYFQQAIDSDPAFGQAYAGLADAYALIAGYGPVPPHDAFPRAKAAARKALEIDDTIAEAHTSLAFVLTIYDFDWARGEQEFKRAIELNPNYATGHHWYGHYLMFVQRFDEAVAEMRRARELDPLSPINTTEVGYPWFFARQYDRAIADYKKAIDLTPDFYRAHWLLGQAYEQKQMYPEAVAAMRKAIDLSGGNPVMMAALAHVQAMSGNRAEARKTLDTLTRLSRDSYFSPYFIAELHLALGETQDALDWLERAYDGRDYFLRWLKIDPRLDALRDQPRFQALERRMNYPSTRGTQ
jgi:serine/threonine-protein kinase